MSNDEEFCSYELSPHEELYFDLKIALNIAENSDMEHLLDDVLELEAYKNRLIEAHPNQTNIEMNATFKALTLQAQELGLNPLSPILSLHNQVKHGAAYSGLSPEEQKFIDLHIALDEHPTTRRRNQSLRKTVEMESLGPPISSPIYLENFRESMVAMVLQHKTEGTFDEKLKQMCKTIQQLRNPKIDEGDPLKAVNEKINKQALSRGLLHRMGLSSRQAIAITI